jgi:ABC-type transporter Mla subunit MlaD
MKTMRWLVMAVTGVGLGLAGCSKAPPEEAVEPEVEAEEQVQPVGALESLGREADQVVAESSQKLDAWLDEQGPELERMLGEATESLTALREEMEASLATAKEDFDSWAEQARPEMEQLATEAAASLDKIRSRADEALAGGQGALDDWLRENEQEVKEASASLEAILGEMGREVSERSLEASEILQTKAEERLSALREQVDRVKEQLPAEAPEQESDSPADGP